METPVISGREIRRLILEESYRAGVGHIGSALSVADVIAALYSGCLRIPALNDPDRDRFILSKGHASLALYAALHLRGWIDREELSTYCADGTFLGVHPERALVGVDFSTGSLGHGLTVGAGAALAARMQGSERRTFVLLSDAECNEGSVWEAAAFAGHHRLGNLMAIIDLNGQQALGYTRDVLHVPDMEERWRAFGWEALSVDGHDEKGLVEAMDSLDPAGLPRVLVARTTFGKPVSFTENKIEWHYWPMDEQRYARALADLESS